MEMMDFMQGNASPLGQQLLMTVPPGGRRIARREFTLSDESREPGAGNRESGRVSNTTQILRLRYCALSGTPHLGRGIWDAVSGTLHLGRFLCSSAFRHPPSACGKLRSLDQSNKQRRFQWQVTTAC